MIGMGLAIIATIFGYMSGGFVPMLVAMIPAVVIGAFLAARVPMTGMPELVAMLHSFVGIAAVFVGISTYIDAGVHVDASRELVHSIEVFIGVFIGAITFTGSILAFLKLKGSLSGKPLTLPGRTSHQSRNARRVHPPQYLVLSH